MIQVRFLRSFDDTLASLPAKRRTGVEAAVKRLLEYFDGAPKPLGIGLRKLHGAWWEIRAGLDLRVLFTLQGGLATFFMVGSHDDIARRIRH